MVELRPHLQAIERIDSADIRGDFVRLDRNDRATPLAEATFREILATLGPEVFAAYPDPQPLNRRLAQSLGLPEDHVAATNGSDAAIRRAFHAYVGPGDRVVFPEPSYAMYQVYSRVFQGETAKLAYGADRRLDLDRFLALIGEGVRLVCIANPDQPTGGALEADALRRIVTAARQADALCLIDEAYYPSHPVTAVGLIRDYDNLLVTRSFSKSGGIGGLRLGFACAQPAILRGLDKVRGLHEVNQVAIAVGLHLLDHPELIDDYLSEMEAGRALLAEFAERHGFGFPPCPTNFQLIELSDDIDPSAVVQAVKRRGFLVKGGYKAPSVRNCLRVSLAGAELIGRFVAALEQALAEQGQAPPLSAEAGRAPA